MIVREGGGYRVKSESGKNLSGILDSMKAAQKRLQQVEAFKHMDKGRDKK